MKLYKTCKHISTLLSNSSLVYKTKLSEVRRTQSINISPNVFNYTCPFPILTSLFPFVSRFSTTEVETNEYEGAFIVVI